MQLAQLMEIKFARFGESSMLFPTAQHASQCRDFMRAMERRRDANAPDVPIRIVRFSMHPHSKAPVLNQAPILLYIVLFPESLFALAKAFWQHTGVGITSRMAEGCLRILEHNESLLGDCGDLNPQTVASRRGGTSTFSGVPARGGGFGRSRYASRMPPLPARSDSLPARTKSPELITESHEVEKEEMTFEHAMFVEERYGRNLPSSLAARAKDALRRRIAGTLVGEPGTDDSHLALRKVTGVTENDVFLFPCGMAAIFHAHQTIMLERTLAAQSNPVTREGALQALRTMDDPSFVFGPFVPGKAICFGFTYTDTLKVLQKWGPGCHFFGHGTDGDLDKLEALLASQPADEPKILSLFCEFPSNPLLRSPDLKRIRALADTYGFSVVIDETIGNFVNVEVLPYADMVVSSLTKIFSGDCNVMGGSLVLNPRSPRAKSLRAVLEANYQDTLWPEDAIFLERNSRNFVARIAHIDRNAETVSDYLREHSQAGGCADSVVEDVFYPKYVTRHHYDAYRREHPYVEGAERSGFGGLISVQFSSIAPAQAFYNNLAVFKGPSLGTNCTLACPYTLLAHYSELDWAARMNVSNNLVRVSVGLEDTDQLLQVFTEALAAAEAAA